MKHLMHQSAKSSQYNKEASSQLKEMLDQTGFKTLDQFAIDGSQFIENKSERVLTIAKKIHLEEFHEV